MSGNKYQSPRARAEAFSHALGIRLPVLLAPMAGASPPSLSIAVANAGGLGACGTLLMQPEEIKAWAADFRRQSKGEFQLNLWIPDPVSERDHESEKQQREYLSAWGPPVPPEAGDAALPDFEAQCQAMIDAAPKVISSIMGLYAPAFVSEMKERGILWFATATTVAEARAAEAAGADAIIAQGMEAGGHRGAFHADAGGTSHGWPHRSFAPGGGRGERTGHCHGRNWRCARNSCGPDSGRQRGADRNRLPAISGGDDASSVRGHTCKDGSPRNQAHQGFQRTPRTKCGNSIRSRIAGPARSATSAVPYPAWSHSRYAGRCSKSRRCRPDATMGRPGCLIGTR